MDVIAIFIEFTTSCYSDFEDLEPELLRLSKFEPLQQITGVAEFLGEEFIVTKDTLIPSSRNRRASLKVQSFLEQCPVGEMF